MARTPSTSLLLLGFTLALALGAGFEAHRLADTLVKAPDAKPEAAPATAAPVEPVSDSLPDLTADPADLPDHALAAWNDANYLDAGLAFYRWLETADGEAIEYQLASWQSDKTRVSGVITRTAYARWAELAPTRLAELHGDERDAQRALWIARLRQDPGANLTDCPDNLRIDCRRYVAALHPTFDLAWAHRKGLTISWYVRMWLERGLRPDDLLANAQTLDPEVVQAAFQYEASKTTAQGLSVARLARLLETLVDSDLLEAAREGIAQGASYITEPLERLKMLDQLDIPLKRSPQSPNIFHRALSERPDETIAWLLTLEPAKRQAALRGIFSGGLSGNTDTKGWHDLYLRLPREELPSIFKMNLYFGRNSDSETVLSWFGKTIERNHFVSGDDEASEKDLFFSNAQDFGSQLALQNVGSALAQARQIEDDKLRNALLLGIGTAAATFDPESARSLLPELEESDRTALETVIFEQEFKALPLDEALGTLAAIPDANRRTQLASSLLFENSISPDRRAAVVDEHPVLFRSSLGLVIQWANQDPRTAAEWIAQYAGHPGYPRNVERLVEAWARHDIVEAAHWVLEQEPGAARDKSIAAISEQVVDRDPHRALEWAAALSDPQERLEHLQDAAVSLDRYATQANEAVEALAGLSLSESERTKLLQHLEEAP